MARDDVEVAVFVAQVLSAGALFLAVEGPGELASRVVVTDLLLSLHRITGASFDSGVHLVLHGNHVSIALQGPSVIFEHRLVVLVDVVDLIVLVRVE